MKISTDLRPISLTAVLSKQLEFFIGSKVWDCISSSIDVSQYGAQKGTVTTHALVDMMHKWFTATEHKETVHKSYDHICHNVLAKKLTKCNVPDILVRWVCAFLQDREQRVRMRSDISDWMHMNGSIPQGTWFGPMAFIFLVIDLLDSQICR